jgi:hypothetical protein
LDFKTLNDLIFKTKRLDFKTLEQFERTTVHIIFNLFQSFPFLFQDVSIMANSLEKFFISKVKQMPQVEVAMTPEQLRKPTTSKKTPGGVGLGGSSGLIRKRILPSGSAPDSLNNSLKVIKPSLVASPVKHSSLPATVSQPIAGKNSKNIFYPRAKL